MKLESGRQSVELRPVRYQFPDMVASDDRWDWDVNRLQVAGHIRDGDLEFVNAVPVRGTASR